MKKKENKSIFLEYFGDTPQLRVFDFLIGNYFFDFPLTEIARESNVSYNSLKVFLPKLIESRILVRTRRIRKSDYYKLNAEHPFIRNLIKMNWMLVKSEVLGENEPKIAVNNLRPA
mgnify:CR=1 FL=1